MDNLTLSTTGLTLVANYFGATGSAWNATAQAWETWSSTSYNAGHYAVTVSEVGGSGSGGYRYQATTPPTVAAGGYAVVFRQHVDGTAAHDLPVGTASQDPNLITILQQTSQIATQGVQVIGSYVAGVMTLIRGDSYTSTSGKSFSIPKPAGVTWPADLTGWTVTLYGQADPSTPVASGQSGSFSATLSVTNPSTTQTLVVSLPASTTSTLAPMPNGWTFRIVATSGSDQNTLLSGLLSVLDLSEATT